MPKPSRYARLVSAVFSERYQPGQTTVRFTREDMVATAERLGLARISNIGDALYSFRFRASMPEEIASTAPTGMHWAIRFQGTSRYAFVLVRLFRITPNPNLAEIKIPDATPEIVLKYAQTDEQALLAKVRYNRLVDLFLGITAHSL